LQAGASAHHVLALLNLASEIIQAHQDTDVILEGHCGGSCKVMKAVTGMFNDL
jgi:hypothetical protein